jgi:hypothetical protein
MEEERRGICLYNTTYCFELSVGNIVCFTQEQSLPSWTPGILSGLGRWPQ